MEYPKIPNVFKREEGNNSNKLIEGAFTSEELQALAGMTWVWTEKVDGTNIRVIWDGYRVEFRGRTDKACIPGHLLAKLEELFGGPDKEELFEQKFGEKPVILFGEGFGEKIQSGGKYGPVNFILFDVLVGEHFWLDQANVENIAESFGIQTVPVVGIGSLHEAVAFIKRHPKSWLKDDTMEGVVCRPVIRIFDWRGDRFIVKIKCRDFPKEANANENQT